MSDFISLNCGCIFIALSLVNLVENITLFDHLPASSNTFVGLV